MRCWEIIKAIELQLSLVKIYRKGAFPDKRIRRKAQPTHADPFKWLEAWDSHKEPKSIAQNEWNKNSTLSHSYTEKSSVALVALINKFELGIVMHTLIPQLGSPREARGSLGAQG